MGMYMNLSGIVWITGRHANGTAVWHTDVDNPLDGNARSDAAAGGRKLRMSVTEGRRKSGLSFRMETPLHPRVRPRGRNLHILPGRFTPSVRNGTLMMRHRLDATNTGKMGRLLFAAMIKVHCDGGGGKLS